MPLAEMLLVERFSKCAATYPSDTDGNGVWPVRRGPQRPRARIFYGHQKQSVAWPKDSPLNYKVIDTKRCIGFLCGL